MLKKILILRFSSIGDIVLTTPVLRCLRLRYPKAQIHFLCKTNFISLLESNPYVDKCYHFSADFKQVFPKLKAEQYDVVIDLHKNLRSYRLRFALGVKSYSFHKANWAKWLMVNFKINRLPTAHIVDRYLATVKPLDVTYDGQGLDYFIPKGTFFDAHQFGLTKEGSFITFAIGAAHSTKRLPVEKIKAICATLSQNVVLLGGPAERNVGEMISNDFGKRIINTCGQLSLHQSADAVRQSELLITHDTGMMHIGAALGKKIISVWGNTIPEFGMYPFYPKGVQLNKAVFVKDLACRPCSKIGHQSCPKGHFQCMNNIDVAEIRKSVNAAL